MIDNKQFGILNVVAYQNEIFAPIRLNTLANPYSENDCICSKRPWALDNWQRGERKKNNRMDQAHAREPKKTGAYQKRKQLRP